MTTDKLIRSFFLLCFLTFALSAFSQSQDSVSFVAKFEVVKNEVHVQKNGRKFDQVFVGSRGGRFVVRKSGKSGQWYKQYLPKVATN